MVVDATATSHILTPPAPGMPPRYTGTRTAPFLTAAAAAGTPAAQRAPAPVSTPASPPSADDVVAREVRVVLRVLMLRC